MSSEPETDDRRAHPRFDLLAQVHVRGGQTDLVLEIVNLSQGGALVDLASLRRPRWIAPAREVELRLMEEDGKTAFAATARIVRVVETLDSRTFAVQFDEELEEAVVRRACAATGAPPPLPRRA